MRRLALLPVLLVLSACGGEDQESGEDHLSASSVVQCRTPGDQGAEGAEVYAEGATADSPAEAMEVARSERRFDGAQDGFTVAREEGDRVLYVLEVDGVVRQAVVVRDGPATEGAGGDGWYVESWARCDYAELPRDVADSIGLEIWSDASGRPVPTTELEARRGPEHCGWQSTTFLTIGKDTYLRAPVPDLTPYLSGEWRAHATLPRDAVATGFQRAGQRLWLSPDRRRVYVGSPNDVEVWPRADGVACM